MPQPSRKAAAIDFLTMVAAGEVREAFTKHIGSPFRHHNQYFRGDAASLMEAMEDNAKDNPNKTLEVKQALEDGELVATFSHIRQNPQDRGAAVVHIFRFEGDRIVEAWDAGQAIEPESINENGAF